MKRKSSAQISREGAREGSSGRFIKNPCDLCGKGAPLQDYFSWSCANEYGGMGMVLHERCADKLEQLPPAEVAELLVNRRR